MPSFNLGRAGIFDRPQTLEEVSSHETARDWSAVAATVARKSGTRSSLL